MPFCRTYSQSLAVLSQKDALWFHILDRGLSVPSEYPREVDNAGGSVGVHRVQITISVGR